MRRLLTSLIERYRAGQLPWRTLLLSALGTLTAVLALVIFVVLAALERGLPEVATLKTLQLQVPLRVLTQDGKLMGEFGAERRALLKFAEIPPQLAKAFMAAEDDGFYEHAGVDYAGLLRATLSLAVTGNKSQGGSTITMQLARNVFLSSEKTFTRKFREILLAKKIERELSKQEILELYLNKIYLGERAYGVGAASLIYFGKPAPELRLEEMAVLAALPKAPSRDNPVANPERALERRNYVLRRMRELGHISPEEYETAVATPVTVRPYRVQVEIEAHYAAEMVRADLYAKYGEEVYARGFVVTTTLDSAQQAGANNALRRALQDYDERHRWRGPEAKLTAEQLATPATIAAALAALPDITTLVPAAVLEFTPERLRLTGAAGPFEIGRDSFAWANLSAKQPLNTGDVVRLRRLGDKPDAKWKLTQIPEVQGAFVALNPKDGAVRALVGGYDFWLNKFNHVAQARRQAGSGFKPFLYAAGLAQGYTPASVFLDAPVVFDDPALESSWRPSNYDNDFNGPMRLREALVQSRNMVSIRLLQALGLDFARDYLTRFGFPADRLPNDLTIALGSAAFTPLEMAQAYAVIANGGFAVEPYLVSEIRDASGAIVFKAEPRLACPECEEGTPAATGADAAPAADLVADTQRAPRVIEPQVAWLISSMMHDVTVRGTGAAVAQLGRSDLAGKTGTSNDETDAWFNGFQKNLVGIAWVGFDQPQPLGRGEVGGRAALPIWMDFMKSALKGVKQQTWPRPPGIVDIRINARTGKLAAASDPTSLFETVQQEHIPESDDMRTLEQDRLGAEDLF